MAIRVQSPIAIRFDGIDGAIDTTSDGVFCQILLRLFTDGQTDRSPVSLSPHSSHEISFSTCDLFHIARTLLTSATFHR